jgi:hypothetical protein
MACPGHGDSLASIAAEVCASVSFFCTVLDDRAKGELDMRVRFFLARTILPLAALCAFASCTSRVEMPAALGDCTALGDASCANPAYGSGGVSPREAGIGSEAEAASPTPDGGACGVGLLALSSSNPACLPCLETAAPTGCCEATASCAADLDCFGRIVQCASQGAQALATCLYPEDQTMAQLLTCMAASCGAQCNDLALRLTTDQ